MHRNRLVSGLAMAFAAMTLVLAGAGLVFNYVILLPAVFFAAVTYLLWEHATGRLAARLYRQVERQGAPRDPREKATARGTAGGDPRREAGGFGAGPKADWEGGDTWRERVRRVRERRARARAERRAARAGASTRAPGGASARGRAGGQGSGPGPRRPQARDGPTLAEAYETLGVTPDADADEVRAAYRERVKEVHPDTEGGDEEAFKRVSAAYDRLT